MRVMLMYVLTSLHSLVCSTHKEEECCMYMYAYNAHTHTVATSSLSKTPKLETHDMLGACTPCTREIYA
jgi:hypothetical protein